LSLAVGSGCNSDAVLYPLDSKCDRPIDFLAGKWCSNDGDNVNIAFDKGTSSYKVDITSIKKDGTMEKIVPLRCVSTELNGDYYLSLMADLPSLFSAVNCNSESNNVFFITPVYILKIIYDGNVLSVYTISFAEKSKIQDKILWRPFDARLRRLENSNLVLNSSTELKSFIKTNKFKPELFTILKKQ
jgi:hypothetical protein